MNFMLIDMNFTDILHYVQFTSTNFGDNDS